jgi:hypothetical protein
VIEGLLVRQYEMSRGLAEPEALGPV